MYAWDQYLYSFCIAVPTIRNTGIDYQHRALVQAVGMACLVIISHGGSQLAFLLQIGLLKVGFAPFVIR